jgi:hypothetical protein
MLLLCALFVCISASAQYNPYVRQRRGAKTYVRSGMSYNPDSVELARRDSIRVAKLVDTLKKLAPDSLVTLKEAMRSQLPDSIHKRLFAPIGADTLKVDSLARDSLALDTLTAKQRKRLERKENRKPFLSDSMALRKVCYAAAVLPGYGQIYNKQYWKLPILYGTVGASLGLCLWSQSKYKPLKTQFEAITDQSLYRTPELNKLQREMIKYNTMKQIFMVTTIASYLYFIGDAAIKYSTNEVSRINKATTLSTICPGAGQIYNQSYWRVPIVVGGFATTVYCIDWNNRGYQRFKKAYRLRADYDANPSLYPSGSQDEFRGRYSASFLKNLRNSYRRNRDLCIILTAGLYILQIVDAHVDAHMRDYDISKDLSVSITPTIGYSYNRMSGYSGNGGTTIGMNIGFTF